MNTFTLLLVGRDNLFREGLKSLLAGSAITVFDGPAEIEMLASGTLPDFDVVLVECPGDLAGSLDALRRVGELNSDAPVVVISDEVRMASVAACLAAGANGFLTKEISPDALQESLRLVTLGETVFPTCLAGLLAEADLEQRLPGISAHDDCGLSGREVEALRHLLKGDSNKLIAKYLGITEATVKVHMKSVLRKIRVSNRTQAAIWAHGHGYLPAGAVGLTADGKTVSV